MDIWQFNTLLNKAYYDEKAFERLYDFYYKRIVLHFCKYFGKDLAEDVAQDFFIKIVVSCKEYEYIKNPTAWVYTCCANIAKTKFAKETREITFNEEFGVDTDFGLDFEKLFLGVELDRLDELTKKIVILHYWQGYHFEEISKILGITSDAIRQRHKRLKKKLKYILL